MTRVFQCRPSVAMHHHRSAWAANTTASIGQPSAGTNGRSAAAPRPGSRPAARCAGRPSPDSGRAPNSTPPRARLQAAWRCDTDELGEPLDARPRRSATRTRSSVTASAAAPARRRNPGPSPSSARACRPAAACARASRRTCSTDDDDRLPISASERHDSSSASSSRSSAAAHRLEHLRAAGMRRPTSRCRRSSGRGRRGSR